MDRTLREFMVGEFQGQFPDVPISPKVNLNELLAGDEDPFYVTLPVAQLNRVSSNGLLYDEALVEAIEAQMVGKGGIMGHLKDEDRDSAFPVEDVDWVGVKREGDMTWGKAYVPPGKAREFLRRVKARGGKLATSIYGPHGGREALPDGSWKAADFKLESLDLAPADRAALKMSGEFAVTKQMDDSSEDDDMKTKEQILAELTLGEIPDALRDQVIQEYRDEQGETERVTELETNLKTATDRVAELEKQIADQAKTVFLAKLDGVIAETIKVEALRPVVRRAVLAELEGEADEEKAQKALKEYCEGEEFQNLAKAVITEQAGPAAIIPGVDKDGKDGKKNWKDQIAAKAPDLAKEIGAV